MFKHYFDSIEGITIWPIISLLIFVTFFIGLGFWLFKLDNNYINKMKKLPLDDNSDENSGD